MKALVLGANGCLGKALTALLPTHDGGGFEVEARTRSECDVTDAGALARIIAESEADVVFNASGFTNVDRAEDDPDGAYQANALAPENMARVTGNLGVKLIHYSTDFVFDGELDRPYDEFDTPAPQGIYARSKLAGERLALAASRKVFVVRVGWLYGRGGRNFPSTILDRLLAGETVRADRERLGSPTWVRDVASVSGALAHTEHYGLYHCTSSGETSWAEYARFVAAELNLPAERVEALPTAALPMMRAPRPRRSVLDNRLLHLRGLDTMPNWQVAARAFIGARGSVT